MGVHMRRVARRLLIVAMVLGLVLGLTAVSAANNGNGRSYSTSLSGSEEVGPVFTDATGRATFQAVKNGTVLNFQVRVKNIEGVTQAHIHLAPAGSNGGIVAFLFGFVAAGTSGNGSLATGKITDSDLIGALAGQTIPDLIAEIEAGGAYVNVHTLANPGGEIRGQIG